MSFNSRHIISSQRYRLHQDWVRWKTQWCQTMHTEQCTNISNCCATDLGATDLTSDQWLLCHGWLYQQFSIDTNYTVHLSESYIYSKSPAVWVPFLGLMFSLGGMIHKFINLSFRRYTPSLPTHSLSLSVTHTHTKALVTKLRWFKNYVCSLVNANTEK